MFASIHCMNPLHDENETHERMFLAWATSTRPRHTTNEEALRCTVSLVNYVCSNPLHEENETHERMFFYALTWVDVAFNM